MINKVAKSKQEWKKVLTPLQFKVTREKGTEPPFANAYNGTKEKGVYRCSSCCLPLFGSETKYDSGTGWPSFYEPINYEHVKFGPYEYNGTEVLCARCDAHLGHVFDDGPAPTEKRYCMNSVALLLDKKARKEKLNLKEEYQKVC